MNRQTWKRGARLAARRQQALAGAHLIPHRGATPVALSFWRNCPWTSACAGLLDAPRCGMDVPFQN